MFDKEKMRLKYILCTLILMNLTACKVSQEKSALDSLLPMVETLVIQPRPVMLTTELPGRTSPYRIAEIRPQVDGIILKRLFTEGQDVTAGQDLFQIDDARYRAALGNAQGALARARANLPSSQVKVKRFKELMAMKAVSQQEYDDAVATFQSYQADDVASQAAVDTAKINLAHTKITSPITGRIGQSLFTEGSLGVTNQSQPLAVVQQLDPIYVDITQPYTDIMKLKRALNQNNQDDNKASAVVTLLFDDGTKYSTMGTLEFTDITVDQSTNAVTVRAVFPNPHHELLPGMFVRAVLNQGELHQALCVPQQAVSRDRNGKASVMIVNAESKVEIREIITDRAIHNQWLVQSGIYPGDRVIMSGTQKIKPGIAVTYKDLTPFKN